MIKVFSAFAGYGTDNFALKRLGIEHECMGFSEIDKYAVECFHNNHGVYAGPRELHAEYGDWQKIHNYGDIKSIDPNTLPDFDLFTGGFPCQAFSVAGKGQGELDPRGTLFYEIIRICEVKKPRWIFLENVKGLLSKKHKATFDKILSELERIGYIVKWKVLNTKEHGIPQNRERVFFCCFKYKVDADKFEFPDKEELKLFIKDILEPEPVDAKYYLKPKQIDKLLEAISKKKMNSRRMQKEVSSTLLSRDYKDPKVVEIGTLNGDVANTVRSSGRSSFDIKHTHDIRAVQWDQSGKGYNSQQDRAYDTEGVMACLPNANPTNKVNIFALRSYPRTGTKEVDGERFQNPEFNEDGTSNSLTGVQKDNLVHVVQRVGDRDNPSISIKEDISNTISANAMSDRGQILIVDPYNESIPKDQEVATTLRTNSGNGNTQIAKCITEAQGRQGSSKEFLGQVEKLYNNLGIFRRLTPKECFRLQGFLNDEISLEGLSDTQKYKLAGNGQSVNVVTKIFERMLK